SPSPWRRSNGDSLRRDLRQGGEDRGQSLVEMLAVPQRRELHAAARLEVGGDFGIIEVAEAHLLAHAVGHGGLARRRAIGVGDDIEELGHEPIMTWIWTTRPGFAGDLAEELGGRAQAEGPAVVWSESGAKAWPIFARAGFPVACDGPASAEV